MASFETALDYVMRQEDRRMLGNVSNDPSDRGGRTRFGISEKYHPDLTPTGYFDNMPRQEALGVAVDTYRKVYDYDLCIAGIASQEIANALLSFAINEGTKTAIRCLQQALNIMSSPSLIASDGRMGPATLNLANAFTPAALLRTLSTVQTAHYQAIVAGDASQSRFINGWLNRVHENCGAAA